MGEGRGEGVWPCLVCAGSWVDCGKDEEEKEKTGEKEEEKKKKKKNRRQMTWGKGESKGSWMSRT